MSSGGTDSEARVHRLELPKPAAAALGLLAENAEAWGGRWQAEGREGGRLGLPVVAGLRRGWVAGPVKVEAAGRGSRLSFRVEQSDYRLQKASVFTLVLAGCGALVTLIAPFFPALLALVPIGILLCIAAWLFIVARLSNSGPEEFFEDLAELAAGEPARGKS